MTLLRLQQRAAPYRCRRRVALLGAGALVAGGLLAFAIPLARADNRKSADFVIIVNRSNPSSELGSVFVAEAFLKKTTRWSNGESIRPVDLPADSFVRRRFSDGVLKRSVAAVRSYWQQRIFTGRDVPPPELDSDEAVVRYVAKYPGGIGYVAPGSQGDGVKVVLLRAK